MFLTSGYVLIMCVVVILGFIYTFRSDFSKMKLTFLVLGCHVLQVRDFRRDVLRQRVLRDASLLCNVASAQF